MKASSKSFSKNVSIAGAGEGGQGREEGSKNQRSTACPNISPETNNKFNGNCSNPIKLVFRLFSSSQG